MATYNRRPGFSRNPERDYQDVKRFAKASAEANRDQVQHDIQFLTKVLEYEMAEIYGDAEITVRQMSTNKLVFNEDGSIALFCKDEAAPC